MATYIYETTDASKPVRRFEIQQSMKDAPLSVHPETGEPIQRVITGGYGYLSKGNGSDAASSAGMSGGHCCGGGGCGCH